MIFFNLKIVSQNIDFIIEIQSKNPFNEKSLFTIDKNEINDSLINFINEINSVEINDFYPEKQPDEFEISLYNYKENQKKYLKNNFPNLNINIQSIWEEYVFFKYHDLLSQYIIYNKRNIFDFNYIPYFTSEEIYFNSIKKDYKFPIFKDYIYHMTLLMTSKNNNESLKMNLFINSFINYSKMHLNEDLFVYCSSRFVYEHIVNIDNDIFYDFVNQMEGYKSFELYRDFLIEENEKNIKLLLNTEKEDEFDETELLFYLEDLQGNITSLNNFYGKYLYVDLWASWCGPCKKQFKYVKDLKKDLKKKHLKKIKFVYISIDKDYSSWKNAIKKYDIDGEHFISPANKLNNAGEYFNVSGIPRYIVIDPNGNIIDENAKRPSDPDIKEFLLKLID